MEEEKVLNEETVDTTKEVVNDTVTESVKPNEENKETQSDSSEKVVYDIENEPETKEEENKENVVYDLEDEIKEKHDEFMKDAKKDDEEELVDENQPNVFDKGLHNGEFLVNHLCPMCGLRKKSISEMYSKRRFKKEKKVIGYMSICANCGFVSFYATNPNDLLRYLSGKAVK